MWLELGQITLWATFTSFSRRHRKSPVRKSAPMWAARRNTGEIKDTAENAHQPLTWRQRYMINPCPFLRLEESTTDQNIFTSGISRLGIAPDCILYLQQRRHDRFLPGSPIVDRHGRPHIGANGLSWPPWRNAWKNKKRKRAKKSSLGFYVYVIFWEQSGQEGVENGAMLTTYLFRYTSFRSQIFKIFFASSDKGALTPLTKILRTFLLAEADQAIHI